MWYLHLNSVSNSYFKLNKQFSWKTIQWNPSIVLRRLSQHLEIVPKLFGNHMVFGKLSFGSMLNNNKPACGTKKARTDGVPLYLFWIRFWLWDVIFRFWVPFFQIIIIIIIIIIDWIFKKLHLLSSIFKFGTKLLIYMMQYTLFCGTYILLFFFFYKS